MLDEDADPYPVPVGYACHGCGEPMREGDRGPMRVYFCTINGKPMGSFEPIHTECDLLETVGHQFGVCPCNGFGNTRSDGLAALAALNAQRAKQGMGPL